MPRKPRLASESGYYHFINRGVNKKKLFHSDSDYLFYKKLLGEYKEAWSIDILHYSLMGNHTHCVVRSFEVSNLSRFGHFIQRRYAYYYCKTHKWSEQVFRSRFLSLPVEKDSHLLECARYIERNCLDHCFQNPDEYPHSSYHYYAKGTPDPLVTESPVYAELAATAQERQKLYRFYVQQERVTDKAYKRVERFIGGRKPQSQPVPF